MTKSYDATKYIKATDMIKITLCPSLKCQPFNICHIAAHPHSIAPIDVLVPDLCW